MKIFNPQDKVLANIDYIRRYLEEGYAPPVLVEVDPSNACNHKCHFCISSYVHLPESRHLPTYNAYIMPEELLLGLSKDLIDIKTKAINWTGGGEPTVNPALKDAIDYIGSQSNVKMGMFTNGTLLDKFDLFNTVIENLTWIRFSIDAATKQTYELTRRSKRGLGWNKMIANLEKLISLNNNKIDIGVGFVITPGTYKEIVKFAKFFDKFDLTYCQFKPEIVNKERAGGLQRTIEFWKTKVDPYLKEAKQILGNKFQVNGYKLADLTNDIDLYGRTYEKCIGSQLSPCVGADGHVYVCTNHRGYKEYSYGNLRDQSFKEIWQNILLKDAMMDKIEKKEKFSRCTQLCKPHESNKKLWDIYKKYCGSDDQSSFFSLLEEQCKDIDVKHSEFI